MNLKSAALASFLLFMIGAAATGSAGVNQPAGCRISRFTLTLGPPISEATGQHTLAVRLRNGGVSCVLDGYPAVVLSDSRGRLPLVVRHDGDQMISARRPTRIVVEPGGVAFVVLNQYRCDRGVKRAADVIRIGLARATHRSASTRIGDPYRRPSYCGRGDPGSTLTISPFVPNVHAALNH